MAPLTRSWICDWWHTTCHIASACSAALPSDGGGGGRRAPHPVLTKGVPHPVLMGGGEIWGTPPQLARWGTPSAGWGYPPSGNNGGSPHWEGYGYPLGRILDGIPPSQGGWGIPPSARWGQPPVDRQILVKTSRHPSDAVKNNQDLIFCSYVKKIYMESHLIPENLDQQRVIACTFCTWTYKPQEMCGWDIFGI